MKLGARTLFSGRKQQITDADKSENTGKSEKVDRKLQKRQQAYQRAHDQLADSIEIRNKTQSRLTEKVVNKGTQNEALQQVGLSQANKFVTGTGVPNGLREADLPLASQLVGDTRLAKGFLDGFSARKAANRGMTPEQYAQPAAGAKLQAGGEMLKLTPETVQTATTHRDVLKRSVRFERAGQKLHDTRMTSLTATQGDLRTQKHGRIQSGSYQANSPEELAAVLNKTRPESHIQPDDIMLPVPGPQGLLPKEAPPRLSSTVNLSQRNVRRGPELTPQQKTERELAGRDRRITELDAQLSQQDPVALQKAVRERDYYQTQTGGDVLKGLASTPAESATLGLNQVYQWIPKAPNAQPLFSGETIRRAEDRVGYAVGHQVAGGNAEKALRAQTQVETLHAKGKPIAGELHALRAQKAMETDRAMIVDRSGEKYYDAFETPGQVSRAGQRYHDEALGQFPRREDHLYLNGEIVRPVPQSVSEWIRRPLGAEPGLSQAPGMVSRMPGEFPSG